jgi:hypothetical protein
MTAAQFNIVMDKLDKMEARIRRLEIWVATAGGAGAATMFYIGNKLLNIGG